jgi:hypothetical protein
VWHSSSYRGSSRSSSESSSPHSSSARVVSSHSHGLLSHSWQLARWLCIECWSPYLDRRSKKIPPDYSGGIFLKPADYTLVNIFPVDSIWFSSLLVVRIRCCAKSGLSRCTSSICDCICWYTVLSSFLCHSFHFWITVSI